MDKTVSYRARLGRDGDVALTFQADDFREAARWLVNSYTKEIGYGDVREVSGEAFGPVLMVIEGDGLYAWQKRAGVTYEWKPTLDARTRPAHDALDALWFGFDPAAPAPAFGTPYRLSRPFFMPARQMGKSAISEEMRRLINKRLGRPDPTPGTSHKVRRARRRVAEMATAMGWTLRHEDTKRGAEIVLSRRELRREPRVETFVGWRNALAFLRLREAEAKSLAAHEELERAMRGAHRATLDAVFTHPAPHVGAPNVLEPETPAEMAQRHIREALEAFGGEGASALAGDKRGNR